MARSCSRDSKLSEYVRAEARDRSSRGTEKNRNVVMPHASPRVGANVEDILNKGRGCMYSVLKDCNGVTNESTCLVDVWCCGELLQLTEADGMLGTILGFGLG